MLFKIFTQPIFWGTWLFAGCQPLFNPYTQHQIKHIRIERIDNRIGQKLRQKLDRRIQSNDLKALYTLNVVLSEIHHALVLNRQGQNAVGHYILKAHYTLSSLHDHRIVSQGVTRCYSVKPLSISYYSQTVMDQAMQDRAIDSTVEKLMYALVIALHQEPPCPCINPPSDPCKPKNTKL